MSKAKAAAPPAKEEEEWVDEEGEYEAEEEEEDTTIANSDVVMRFKAAAKWTNEVVTAVAAMCKVDASVAEICQAGDKLIAEKVLTNFKGAEKGVAFPTCVSVNARVCHFNGGEGEDVKLALNDICRIDLGIHVDGYATSGATTIQVTATGELNPEAPESAVLAAGQATLDAAIRQLRPGTTTTEVSAVIEKCAAHFGLTAVDGVLSHQVKRYIIDGFKTIPNKAATEHKVHEYDIEENQVWCMDIVLTTGKGQKLKDKGDKPCVFKASIDGEYKPKLEAAFAARGEIMERFQYFPFALSALKAPKARLGMSELNKHGVTAPMPVLCEREGETVVHVKATVLVTPKKIEKICGVPLQKGAPAPKPFEEELLALAKKPLSLVDKKKK